MIQMRVTPVTPPPTLVKRQQRASRSYSRLVQINGRYALALVLDGIVLCVVPVGTQPTSESAAFEAC
jgi:hypothetical protein